MTTFAQEAPPLRKYRRVVSVALAVFYSLILSVAALFMAGCGDGSYVLFGIFSAPFGLLALLNEYIEIPVPVLICLMAIPLLWITAAILGTFEDSFKRRLSLGVFLFVHYASAVLILRNEDYCNWKVFYHQTEGVIGGVVILFILGFYLLGQIWIWFQLLRRQ